MAELIDGLIETIQSIGSTRFDLTAFIVLIIVKVVIAYLLKAAGCGGAEVVPIVGVILNLILRSAGYDQTGVVILIVKTEIGVLLKAAGCHKTGHFVLIVVLIVLLGIALSNV